MKQITQKMALGAILALQACGADPAAQTPVAVPAPVPVPAPTVQECRPGSGFNFTGQLTPNTDILQAYFIPMLQARYCNLEVMSRVVVPGTNIVIEPGVYTWAQMYSIVVSMVNACGCFINNAAMPQGMSNGFINLNFNNFYLFVGGDQGVNFNPWYNVEVRTQSGLRTNFFEIFNMLVGLSYSYYSTYYYNYVYVYGSWPTWNVWPGNTVGAFLNYNSGNGFSINLGVGAIINF